MKTSILFLLVCLNTSYLLAQKGISKATIKDVDGRDMEVFILHDAYEGTPQNFEYSTSKEGPFTTMPFSLIRQVRFDDGTVLEKHSIHVAEVAVGYMDRQLFDYSDRAKMHSGPSMVEKLVEGNFSLFCFRDRYTYPHFFYKEKNNSELVYLANRTYMSDEGLLIKDQTYINLINNLLSANKCSISRKNPDYTINEMTAVFKEVNECAGGIADVKRSKNKSFKLGVGLLAGVSNTNLNTFVIRDDIFPGVRTEHFGSSFSPSAGVYFEIIPAKKLKNYKASLEFIYQTYRYTTDSIHFRFNSGKGTISQKMINVNPMIKFLMGRKKVDVAIEGGLNFYYVFSSRMNYQFMDLAYNNLEHYDITTNNGLGTGVLLGIGVDFGKTSLHTRFGLSEYAQVFLLAKYSLF